MAKEVLKIRPWGGSPPTAEISESTFADLNDSIRNDGLGVAIAHDSTARRILEINV